MTNQGDDCYFYYYSTCTKGDCCPFRHCEAAMGSEVVCSLWEENRCFRKVCKFRHMEMNKKRSEIPCYWENQPAGCQKPHCAFHHEKARFIDGMFVPPSKVPLPKKEAVEETPAAEPAPPAPAPVTNPANPQLRGVMKAETLENVPSPTHPPVVINPADDEDEDEDDLMSEEGEEMKAAIDGSRMVSPRKVNPNKDDILDFGIQTLEEIRLKKALKASFKKLGASSHHLSLGSGENGAGVEENIRSQLRQSLPEDQCGTALQEEHVKQRIVDRLGKKLRLAGGELRIKGNAAVNVVAGINPPLKRSLAERLGRKVDGADDTDKPGKAAKPVWQRLGLPAASPPGQDFSSETSSSGGIRIKTLEEIRQEKAGKPQRETKRISTSPAVTKAQSPTSEVLNTKKMLEQIKLPTAAESPVSGKGEGPSDDGQEKTSPKPVELRVKTLEEIRREKATRLQARSADVKEENGRAASEDLPRKRILRISKATPAGGDSAAERRLKHTDPDPSETGSANGKTGTDGVKVKTFEEIMREKQLRKQQQQLEESPVHDCATQEKASEPLQPPRPLLNSGRQRLPLKAKHQQVVEKVLEEQTVPDLGPVKPKQASPGRAPGSPSTPEVIPSVSKTSAVLPTEPKVRPKLNVKPSIVKPAAQVKLGQKRKAPESHRSAIAEVKPLNSASTGLEDISPVPNSKLPKVFAKSIILDLKTQETLPAKVPQSMSNIIETGERSSGVPARDRSIVPQSSPATPKTPGLAKSRRLSVPSARAPDDDLDELMNEFTDDPLEDEVELDPGKDEDDLLLELSEMIDS